MTSRCRRENVPAEAEFVQCGVNDDRARQLLAEGGFAVLNHHAAQMDVRVSVADPLRDERINISGLLNLLEGVRAGGVRRVLFASSGGVVYRDTGELPHREEAPKLPVSPYGVSKLASEYYLAAYAMLYGVEVVLLRYANVYGPRQNPHGEAGVVAIFAQRVRLWRMWFRLTSRRLAGRCRKSLRSTRSPSTWARASRLASTSWPRRCSRWREVRCRFVMLTPGPESSCGAQLIQPSSTRIGDGVQQ